MEKILNLKNTVIFVFVAIIWKIFLAGTLFLHPDEAYYWLWSKHLELSYYDHAPMIAYFIKLTTIFSDSELAVRFSAIIAMAVLSVVIWKFVIKLFGSELIASASVILLHSMPIIFSASFIMTPDTPLFLFLSITTFFIWKFIETENGNYWYPAGLFFGLALLSKYTAVLLLPGLAVYIIVFKKYYWFKQYQLYLSLVISCVCFFPVVYWNYQNGWISFAYQLGHGLSSSGYKINYVFDYLGSQMLIFSIILFLPTLVAAFGYLFSKDPKKVFLASVSLSTILFYCFTALKKSPEANWPVPAYFTFAVISAKYFMEGGKTKKILFISAVIFNIAVSVIAGLHAKFTIIPLEKISKNIAKAEATNWFYGYDKLADKLTAENIKYVLTPSHQTSSEIAFYSKNKIKTFADSKSSKKSQYDIWGKPEIFNSNEQGAFVYEVFDDNKSAPYGINDLFRHISKEIDEFEVIRHGVIVRQFKIEKVSN